jgi:O-antigen/teichoic acid export membrane protein
VLTLLEWAAVASLLNLVLSIIAVSHVWPGLKLTLRIPRSEWRHVIVYASSVMGYQFFGVVILLFERGWIIRKFGIESAAFYLVPMNLALLLLGFTGSLLAALFPTLNEHLTDTKLIADLYRRSAKMVAVVAVFAIVAAAAGGRTFLTLWLGREFGDRSYPLLIVHAVTFSIMSLSLVWWQLAEAYRRAPATAYANGAVMIVTLPLMMLLGGLIGLNGVAIGRMIGLTAYFPLCIYVEHRFIGGFSAAFWLRLARTLFLPAIVSYVVIWGLVTNLGVSWLIFVSGVLLGATVYLGMLRKLGVFDRAETLMLRGLFVRERVHART